MASSFTTSAFQMKSTTGTHRVIISTSLTGGIETGTMIRCGTFTVGECQWGILYYPHGKDQSSSNFMSFFVELLSEAKNVDVFLCFSLVDENGIHPQKYKENRYFTYHKKGTQWGFPCLLNRNFLLAYVKDDSFTVEFSLKILEPYIEEEKNNSSISVPPSNMHEHLHHLLQSGEGADISFKVKGETFPAHRTILASRSSVFRAELFGSMSESTARCIEIQDMEPQIFKALLHFIYTDHMLPPSDDHTEEGVDEDIMAQHLTVAADRYALDRLKVICEERLAKKINADNVVTTLALAAQHNCQQLKELCLDYISSSQVTQSFIETDVFAIFMVSCPSIYKELLQKICSKRRT
ncbi:BTB/POZ and MATH domain-containing protein 1-like isoform X1 [Carex littledalei]|uniref:BTB/POZ and MATH domain-containing protein 1-like isoform X1 n=1 Tax=Carex littledalei TaxID=544730 RepID=A0A833R1J5_9POAL|nr:BTB/POZ and MATH domain-containing protein 1-like isoform X1 [Carex littledalei]